MNTLTKISAIGVLVLALAGLSYGQATMASTTSTAAMTSDQTYVMLTAVTGGTPTITVTGKGTSNQILTQLWIDRELMDVVSVSGLRVNVARGRQGIQSGHASGATVYFGPPNYFIQKVRIGPCTSTSEPVLPQIDVATGNIYNCTASLWVLTGGATVSGLSFTSATLTSPSITTDIRATTAGAPSVGTAAKPFGSLILGTAATNAFTFTPAALGAARAITIPDPGGADSLVFLGASQTLTNKTLTSPTLTSAVVGTDIRANTAGSDAIGTAAKPFGSLVLGTAATNAFTFTPAALGAARAITIPDPGGADSLVFLGASQTLTNKTLTSPAVNTATLTGSIYSGETALCTSQFNATSGDTSTTLTNVAGMSVTVVPGTYRFRVNVPGTATANSGIKLAFKYTTTVVSNMEATGRGFTASAVAVQHTTSTADQAALFAQTAAVISTEIEGVMVVGTGGTIQLQAAQNASHADTTSVYARADITFERIS